MTRFARATGSKGSNDKQPEDATPWNELKKDTSIEPIKSAKLVIEPVEQNEIPSAEEIKSVWADLVAETSGKHSKKKSAATNSLGKRKKPDKKFSKAKDVEDLNLSIENSATVPLKKLKRKLKLKNQQEESSDDPPSNIEETVKASKYIKKSKNKMTKIEALESSNLNLHKDDKTNISKIVKKKIKLEKQDTLERQDDVSQEKKKKKKKDKKRPDEVDDAGCAKKNTDTPISKNSVKKEKKRRKEELKETEVFINGRPVLIAPFDGFYVQADDAKRLEELRKNMTSRGIDKEQREKAIKLERRRAEKALARLRKKVCFHCRGTGHNLSECPKATEDQKATGICYKCGSTEHTHFQCKVSEHAIHRIMMALKNPL